MIRCITVDKEVIIASNCNKEDVKKLSRENQLICPNCKSKVIFKAGRVYSPHFAHYDSDCIVSNYERETADHLRGKQVLYEWLKNKYPTADVEYEVYIPETNQIADIFVEHSEEGKEGLRWAFEFQHSPLSVADWETRHNLYKSVGIQDFWILDKAKFMRFSKAQGITDARIRNELETIIFNKTGLCYFLDLESLELTVDFKFITVPETKVIRGVKRSTDYTYHIPKIHSANIEQVNVGLNDEFKHGVLIIPDLKNEMKERLSVVFKMLNDAKIRKEEQELQERAKLKKLYAIEKYGKEQAEQIWDCIKKNRDEFLNDIRYLSPEEFFMKYESIFEKLRLNFEEYTALKNSEDLFEKMIYILSLIYRSSLFSLEFLKEQRERTLSEYLGTIHKEKIDVVTYVYEKYREELEKLATMRPDSVNRKLRKIYSNITPWGNATTAIDYAIGYKSLTIKEADECIKKIKEQIIDYNPFENM